MNENDIQFYKMAMRTFFILWIFASLMFSVMIGVIASRMPLLSPIQENSQVLLLYSLVFGCGFSYWSFEKNVENYERKYV